MDLDAESTQMATVSDESNMSKSDPTSSSSLSDNNKSPVEADVDSGYTSSSEASPDRTTEEEDSSDDYHLFEDDDDDDESITGKIDFIRQKQSLMKRASGYLEEERHYNAATALQSSTLYATPHSATYMATHDPSIWSEAKEVLRVLCQKTAATDEIHLPPPPPRRKRSAPSPRDPTINLSSVTTLSSSAYMDPQFCRSLPICNHEVGATLSTSNCGEGQWMAKALICSEPAKTATSRKSDSRWKVVSDPVTCTLGLVPPTSIALKNAVDLQSAITVTDEARIVTQSTPPFGVVHVNRAFLVLAAVPPEHQSKIIGRAVETLVSVTQSFTGSIDDTTDRYLESIINIGGQAKPCRIRVIPVLDRSRRRRLSDDEAAMCMSHVLIKVVESAPRSILTMEDSSSVSSGNSDDHKVVDPRPGTSDSFGTVG